MRSAVSFRPAALEASPRPCQRMTGRGSSSSSSDDFWVCLVNGVALGSSLIMVNGVERRACRLTLGGGSASDETVLARRSALENMLSLSEYRWL